MCAQACVFCDEIVQDSLKKRDTFAAERQLPGPGPPPPDAGVVLAVTGMSCGKVLSFLALLVQQYAYVQGTQFPCFTCTKVHIRTKVHILTQMSCKKKKVRKAHHKSAAGAPGCH